MEVVDSGAGKVSVIVAHPKGTPAAPVAPAAGSAAAVPLAVTVNVKRAVEKPRTSAPSEILVSADPLPPNALVKFGQHRRRRGLRRAAWYNWQRRRFSPDSQLCTTSGKPWGRNFAPAPRWHTGREPTKPKHQQTIPFLFADIRVNLPKS